MNSRSGRKGKTPIFKRTLGGVTRLLVTAAQNATPVHGAFLKAAEAYCNHNNAELVVVPLRYKNPTSKWTESQANEETWAPEVLPYLCNQRKRLNKNLVLLGDVKTQPTARDPLAGYEALTHGESGILGHPKLALRTIPTPQSRLPKLMTTTGACTVANYTDSRAGKLGEFHHVIGATVVEISGKKFHVRQANAEKETGFFFDLETYYGYTGLNFDDGTHNNGPSVLAAIFGDTHVRVICPDVEAATYGAGGILDVLKPRVRVYHDLLDAESVNPHHEGKPFVAMSKRARGADNVRREADEALQFVEQRTGADDISVLVPSNHNDMLSRWIDRADWKKDPENGDYYLELAAALAKKAKQIENAEGISAFAHVAKQRFGNDQRFKVLDTDESYQIAGIELGLHGDRGPNGARGSIKNLRRIGVKSIIGHSHSPGIDEGCCQVGTSTRLRLSYNSGPSSWLNTHCLIYANGKRTLINIINGEWRL